MASSSHRPAFRPGRRDALVMGLALVAVIAVLLPLDPVLSAWASGLPAPVIHLFEAITAWGAPRSVLVPALGATLVCALAALFARAWRARHALWRLTQALAFVFIGVGVPNLLTSIIKMLVGRERPPLLEKLDPVEVARLLADDRFASFPSGHSTTAAALAMVLVCLWPRLWPAALAYAALIGLSRVVVGAHYPTDVLVGTVIGVVGAYGVCLLFARRRIGFVLAADGTIRPRPLAVIASAAGFRRGGGSGRGRPPDRP